MLQTFIFVILFQTFIVPPEVIQKAQPLEKESFTDIIVTHVEDPQNMFIQRVIVIFFTPF